jgi:hypothetical protein
MARKVQTLFIDDLDGSEAQGIEVKDRGRIPADLVARSNAATGK